MNVLRQLVKVVVDVNDEKEIQEFKVEELDLSPAREEGKSKTFQRKTKALGGAGERKIERKTR